jgi:anti-sigma B factor antagonist
VAFLWQRKTKVSLNADIRAVCERRGPECQVALSGRITIDSSPDLHVLLIQHLQSADCHTLTVDFYEVAYVDTSGLAMLVEILKAARTQGKTFHLSGLRERPRYLLEATRLLHLFDEMSRESAPENNPGTDSPL